MAATYRVLLSFHYHGAPGLRDRLDSTFGGHPVGIMFDSGAYSAKSQGAAISLPNYTRFLQEHQDLAEVCANLDVIGDPDASASNQAALEAAGLHPIPVFHGGSPLPVLENLCNQYPYVALGGMTAPSARAQLWPWLARCFTIAERHGTRLHGFGLTGWQALLDFPFYSVDSSSWGAGHRYGSVPVWDGRRMIKLTLSDPASVYRQGTLLRSYGVEPKLLADRALYHHSVAAGVAAASWLRMTNVIGRTRDLRVYLADVQLSILGYGLQGYLRSLEATA